MHAKSLRIKLIAVFLVAFVCLNAGGAVCVAYCQTAVEAVIASKDHCPLKKKASHCDPGKGEDTAPSADSIGSSKIDCCVMTVSFIAAPIEKRVFSFQVPAVLVLTDSRPNLPISFQPTRKILPSAYRGPPLDHKVDRIKNRVIRI